MSDYDIVREALRQPAESPCSWCGRREFHYHDCEYRAAEAALSRLEAREREKDERPTWDAGYEAGWEAADSRLRTQLERYKQALVYISRWLVAGLPTDDRDVRAIVGIATAALSEPSQGEPDPGRVSALARELGLKEARASVALDGETQSIEPSQGEPR